MANQGGPIRRPRRKPARSCITTLPERIIDGFRYRFGRLLKDGSRRLICSNANSDGCGAEGALSPDEVFTYTNNKNIHSHDPVEDSESNARFLSDLHQATLYQFRKLQCIYDEIAPLHQESAANLTFDKVKDKMESWQKNQRLSDITSSKDFSTSLMRPIYNKINFHNRGKVEIDFLSNDANEHTAIIFTDKEFLQEISTKELFIQSSVRIIPENIGASQLICIATHYADHVFPISWVLMIQKTNYICQTVVDKFMSFKRSFELEMICQDFDNDIISSFQEEVPNAVNKGSFVSHCIIMIGEANRLNLNLRDDSIATIFAKIVAISLLPARSIGDAFRQVSASLNAEEKNIFQPILDYYDNNWIKAIGPEKYSFFKEPWCMYKNADLIIKNMANDVKNNCTAWEFLNSILSISSQSAYHLKHHKDTGKINFPSNKLKHTFSGHKNFEALNKLWTNLENGLENTESFITKVAELLVKTLRNLKTAQTNIPPGFKLLQVNENLEPEINEQPLFGEQHAHVEVPIFDEYVNVYDVIREEEVP